MAEIIITAENFEQEVMKSEKPVLLDFWATWCGPCRMIAPVIEEIAEDYEGKLVVGKVNVDEDASLAAQFRVSSIPTVVIVKNGTVVESSVGYRTRDQLETMIDKHL